MCDPRRISLDYEARMSTRTFGKLAAALATLGLAAGQGAAEAGDPDNPFGRGKRDIVSVSVGGFLTSFNTTARVDSDQVSGSGTEVDLEDDTSLDREQSDLRLDGYWRFARKHRLEFGVFSLRRNANRVIDRQIEFGDTVFDVNGSLSSEFSTDLLKLAYKYSFVRNPRVDAGISFGLSTYKASVSLSGFGTVGTQTGTFSQEEEEVYAPVPLVGAHAEVKLGGDWYFKGSLEYFGVRVSDVEASLTDARADFHWYPFEHFGFGAGYNWVRLSYTNVSSTTVDLQYTYDGVMAYGTYVF